MIKYMLVKSMKYSCGEQGAGGVAPRYSALDRRLDKHAKMTHRISQKERRNTPPIFSKKETTNSVTTGKYMIY